MSLIVDLVLFRTFHAKITPLVNRIQASRSSHATLPDSGSETGSGAEGAMHDQEKSLQAQADALQEEIRTNRALADTLLLRVNPAQAEFENLKQRRDALNRELVILKNRKDAGTEIDVEAFNDKARAFNELNGSVESAYAAYLEGYHEYENLIRKDSILVARFNVEFARGK